MKTVRSEESYYLYQHQAVNNPLDFIDDFVNLMKKHPTLKLHLWLNAVSACLVTGQFTKGLTELESMSSLVRMQNDPFINCHYHLYLFRIYRNSELRAADAKDELATARKYLQQSGSKALEVEVRLAECLSSIQELEMSQSEERLQSLMKTAMESEYPDLVLDINLAIVQVYLENNLPDLSNRDLLVLKELISVSRHPLKYAQMLNLCGIVKSMLGMQPEAIACYREGIALAEKPGFILQLAQLYMNLGIAIIKQGDFTGGIDCYNRSLQLLSGNEALQLELVGKVLMNKARAMSENNQLPESIQIMRQCMLDSQKMGNLRNLNISRINLANALIETGDYPEALSLIDLATEYFTENKLYDLLQNCHLSRARLFEEQEDYKSAFTSMEDLYRTSRMFFYENFHKQNRRYQQRISELRHDYLQVKSHCEDLEQTIDNGFNLDLIGDHPIIKKALTNALQAAKYPFVHVMISGESGTGKEVIARIIHEASQTGKPMVAVNASAISPNLIESELFGHVKGAFTGAISDHKGKFLMANNSTLFLDEISEMPLELQTKLLRAIETRSITPVGASKDLTVHCRIISATNRKMSDLIHNNLFRLDLYHRLNKVEIYLPPLRERLGDLEMLCEHFVNCSAKEFAMPVPKLDDSFYERLRKHHFPGNIRELMNIIERIFILKPRQYWDDSQLDGLVDENPEPQLQSGSIIENLDNTESQIIQNALKQTHWVQKEAAKLLGMTESTLSRHIKRLGIKQR